MKRPYSQACERNSQPILEQLLPLLKDKKKVFEMGTGTGQHATYFAPLMPHLTWQPSEVSEHVFDLTFWLKDSDIDNILSPIAFDANIHKLDPETYDVFYTANTFHFLSYDTVETLIKKISVGLKKDGLLIVYGPFNFDNQYTSESNQAFDQWLKSRDLSFGLLDATKITALCQNQHLVLTKKIPMPANNFILCFSKEI